MRIRTRNELCRGAFFSSKEFLESATGYLSSSFPNPDRTDCPSDAALRSLAEAPRSRTATRISEHIAACSPCFLRYAEILSELRLSVKLETNRRRWWMFLPMTTYLPPLGTTGLVVAFIIVATAVYYIKPTPSSPQMLRVDPAGRNAARAPVRYVIDLGSLSPTRGTTSSTSQLSASTHLPNSPVDLTLLLPLGSDAGRYIVKISNCRGVAWSARATATLRQGQSLLYLRIDLSQFVPGEYDLEVRAAGGLTFRLPIIIANGSTGEHE